MRYGAEKLAWTWGWHRIRLGLASPRLVIDPATAYSGDRRVGALHPHPHIIAWRVADRLELAFTRLARRDFLGRLGGQPRDPVGPPGAWRLLGLCGP